MRRLTILLPLALIALGAPGRAASEPYPSAYGLTQAVSTATFSRMVDMVGIPGQADEAVIALQQAATIQRVSLSGAFAPALYGDLSAYVGGTGNEEGLLSVAFSPNFQVEGRVYVYYTRGWPQPTVLSRFQVSGGVMTTAGPGAETVILTVPDFAENHNGGKIVFGADGYLYLSLGDGGGGGDPQDNGQDLTDLRGKVIRIAVTGQATYAVPPDNPFIDGPGGNADEIYAYGFRNPWRMSYDWTGGEIWVGDVGQGAWEEVEPVAKGGNYGWDCYEGFVVYEPAGCSPSGYTFPRAAYDHGGGNCSVTGGYVYRGLAMPELWGWYVYGDFCSGRIWAVDATPGATSAAVLLIDTTYWISSFAERLDGELFVLAFANQGRPDAVYLLHSDADGDGLGAHADNCPTVFNVGQGDADGDGRGDACDAPGTGNVDCSAAPSGVNSVDALVVLRHSASLVVSQNEPCLDVGQPAPWGWAMGDVDCSSGVDSVDALKILRAVALLVVALPQGCAPISGPP